jgi:hypothetical protein
MFSGNTFILPLYFSLSNFCFNKLFNTMQTFFFSIFFCLTLRCSCTVKLFVYIRRRIFSFGNNKDISAGSMTLAVDFWQLTKVLSQACTQMRPHWNWIFGNCRKSTAKVSTAKFMFPISAEYLVYFRASRALHIPNYYLICFFRRIVDLSKKIDHCFIYWKKASNNILLLFKI